MMSGIIFSIVISIGIPTGLIIYAWYRKNWFSFLLGVLAFVVSQILLRIALLQFLQKNSSDFIMFRIIDPVLFDIIIGLSAEVVEEVARFMFMRFFMTKKDWNAGFLFGAGHGGIEAIIFVGVPTI